ncbi:MAG: hypothetical protein A4E19_16935 [Nitrospira sp. SG-bin1]|nr:MAG: hypothetical protein A4E19_16935 [Nitrospira sp. SG-bin1]
MTPDELLKLGYALARNIQNQLSHILSKDFPTEAPRKLGKIFQGIVVKVISVLETNSDERVLKFACHSLKIISGHLHYLEGSTSNRIPTSMIAPVENLIHQVEPKALFILRAQRSYNYSVFDIAGHYRKMLGPLLGDTLEEVMQGVTTFYVIGIPTVEYPNVLLHAIIAHELGHRVADRYLEQEDRENVVAYVNQLIGPDLKWCGSEYENLPPLFELSARQRVFQIIYQARYRALEELISDAVAFYLLGISALFALEDIASTSVLDALPDESNQFYPPWRYRIRQLLAWLDKEELVTLIVGIDGAAPIPDIRKAVLKRIEHLKDLARDDSDLAIINENGFIERAYRDVPSVLAKMPLFFESKLSGQQYSRATLETEIGQLLERLSVGIPPDEVKTASSLNPPDFRSAIAAGWFYRTARISLPFDQGIKWHLDHDERINRLVLKAIETIELLKDYSAWSQTK